MSVTFQETPLEGVFIVETKVFGDARGYFTEAFNARTWAAQDFTHTFVQDNLSSSSKGTIRGLHYQIAPKAMGKLVRVFTGAVFDVAVDLRKDSPTFGQWVGYKLSAENKLAMWVPEGFGHGFQALEDNTQFYYKCTEFYSPEHERAVRFDDPAIGVAWPLPPAELSQKDKAAPLLCDADYGF